MRQRIPTFFRTDTEKGRDLDNEARRKDLYESCRLEAEEDVARAKARETKKIEDKDGTTARKAEAEKMNQKMRRIWSKSSDILIEHSGLGTSYDQFNDLPQFDGERVDVSEEEARTAGRNFLAWLETQGITLSPDSQAKIFIYAGLHGELDSSLDPRGRNFWERIFHRLGELECLDIEFKPGTRPQKPAPKPVLTQEQQVHAERQEAEAEYQEQVGGMFGQWLDSLASGFNFYPTPEQRNAAVAMLERRGWSLYDPNSFNKCRIALCVNKLWPISCLTKDDYVAHILTERYNFDSPEERKAFGLARNSIMTGTEFRD